MTDGSDAYLHGVLLDVDGTLVDSNDAHAAAWVEALSEAGIRAEFARVRRLIGKGGDKLLPEVAAIEADSTQGKSNQQASGRDLSKGVSSFASTVSGREGTPRPPERSWPTPGGCQLFQRG
jgi:beta-phosphoglucomutase-like phosphatase (HAD superfamily)